jgi:HSP20 family protein
MEEESNNKKYEDFFEELEEMIDKALEDVEKSMRMLLRSEDVKELDKPRFYGFSIQMNDNGMPKLTKFGDSLMQSKDVRTPFYDQYIDKERKELVVIFELPGIEKEELQLKSSTNKLMLDAKNENRSYNAEVILDSEVEPSSALSAFKNGILTVKFKLKDFKDGFTNISII